MADDELSPLVAAVLQQRGITADDRLPRMCALFKDRCDTTVALADWAAVFYADIAPSEAELTQHVTAAVRPALATLRDKLAGVTTWDRASIAATFKEVLALHALKMPQLAMPVRVLVMGMAHTPSVDAVLALAGREMVLARLRTG